MDYLPFVKCKIDSETFSMEVKIYYNGKKVGDASALTKNGKVVYIDYSLPSTSELMKNKIRGEIPQNEMIKACEEMLSTIR